MKNFYWNSCQQGSEGFKTAEKSNVCKLFSNKFD